MKSFKTSLALAALTLCLGAGSAFAQAAAPAAPAPAATTAAPAAGAMTKAQKDAISKACSADADKQNLHGKARKKFRDDCKKKGATT